MPKARVTRSTKTGRFSVRSQAQAASARVALAKQLGVPTSAKTAELAKTALIKTRST